MTDRVAIVSGAAGCVGRAVCMALLSDTRSTWTVYGLGRNSSVASRLPAGVISGHGANLGELHVDALFNCAGNTRHDGLGQKQQWYDNVTLAGNTVKWLNTYHKETKLIHTSTAASYLFHNEYNSSNFYAVTKAIAECMVVTHPNAVILQPCVILGPGDTKNYAQLFNLAKNGKLNRSFEGSIEFGYVTDIAKAHVEAFYSGVEGKSYMLGGVHATWREFFQTINDVVGSGVTVKPLSRWKARMIIKADEWWSCFCGRTPRIDYGTLTLLMRDAKVPTMMAIESKDILGYHASRNLHEMCWLTWQYMKHDHDPSLSQVGVADPEKAGETIATV